jgi:hypothetical protein
MTAFNQGDRVAIIPHTDRLPDGTVREDLATVTNPCQPTDVLRITGEPVGHYVLVERDARPGVRDLGYHEASLRLIKSSTNPEGWRCPDGCTRKDKPEPWCDMIGAHL